jgi:preprotein translocase subunit SecG
MELLIIFLYILFVLSAIVLVVVILLQEGKGGGLTDALGTSGQATFGVGASGINRFTGATAGVFLISALALHVLNRMVSERSIADFGQAAPAQLIPSAGTPIPVEGGAPAASTPPADGGGTAPAGGGEPPK